MPSSPVPSLADALGRWHDFYVLFGTASATLVGLLFVAVTVAIGVFTNNRRAGLRMFLSASVIHFATILVASLLILAPVQTWRSLGVMIAGCGVFGLAYYAMAWRDMMREGLSKRLDMDDRFWYGVLPVFCYMGETGSGIAIAQRHVAGCTALAIAMGVLLVIGIRNAWDITVWTTTRRGETPPPRDA